MAPPKPRWRNHSSHHRTLKIGKDMLQHWPTTDKFQWKGKIYYGQDVDAFVKKLLGDDPDAERLDIADRLEELSSWYGENTTEGDRQALLRAAELLRG